MVGLIESSLLLIQKVPRIFRCSSLSLSSRISLGSGECSRVGCLGITCIIAHVVKYKLDMPPKKKRTADELLGEYYGKSKELSERSLTNPLDPGSPTFASNKEIGALRQLGNLAENILAKRKRKAVGDESELDQSGGSGESLE